MTDPPYEKRWTVVQYVSVSVCSVFADHKNKSITGIQNGTFCATTRNKLFCGKVW